MSRNTGVCSNREEVSGNAANAFKDAYESDVFKSGAMRDVGSRMPGSSRQHARDVNMGM